MEPSQLNWLTASLICLVFAFCNTALFVRQKGEKILRLSLAYTR